jgi:hypothetical protein
MTFAENRTYERQNFDETEINRYFVKKNCNSCIRVKGNTARIKMIREKHKGCLDTKAGAQTYVSQ